MARIAAIIADMFEDSEYGRKITGWKSIREDILNAGAEFVDAEVVEDGRLISSRSPADLPAFIRASLVMLSAGLPEDRKKG